MNTAEIVFNIIQSKLPTHAIKDCTLQVHGWDRKKIQRISKYMAIQNIIGYLQADLPASTISGKVYDLKSNANFPEAGIALEFTSVSKADNKNMFVHTNVCIPCLDTSTEEISKNTFEGIKLWEAFERFYKNKKVYVMESGNAKHMIVDHLCDKIHFHKFLNYLIEHNVTKADLRWVKHSLNGSAVLRVTSGQEGRPEPYLNNWHMI